MINKKGQTGVGFTKDFTVELVGLVIVLVLGVLIVTQLASTSIIKTNNQSKAVTGNFTAGAAQFAGQLPTVFILLGILLVVVVAVIAIRLFSGSGREGGFGG